MFRLCLILAAALGGTAIPAASQPAPDPRPIATSDTGPWEQVVWGVGRRVHYCTVVRLKTPAGEPSYGFLVDRRGTLFSVTTDRWTLVDAPTDVAVKPASGRQRGIKARPASTRRINIDISKDLGLLDDLQRSEHAEVQGGAVTVKLPFDDFNAARIVLEYCVQQIGKDLPEKP